MTLATVVLMFQTVVAEAGWRDRKETEKRDKARRERITNTPRYDNLPTMSFHKGKLRQGTWSGWSLDGVDMQVSPDCKVVHENGEVGSLSGGQEVLVMGARHGNTIVAWSVRILTPVWNKNQNAENDTGIIWSDVDPTVGESSDSIPE